MIQYDGRKMDQHFEKKLIWELLTLMKLQGIKEKELMKNKFSSPSNHNSYQDDYEEITDDENENNDDSNLNHQNAVY